MIESVRFDKRLRNIDDLARSPTIADVKGLRKALLVMHSPTDAVLASA